MKKKISILIFLLLYAAVLSYQFFWSPQIVITGNAAARLTIELGAVCMILVSAFGAGNMLFRIILGSHPAESLENLADMGLGLIALSGLGFALCALHILYHWVIFASLSAFFFYGIQTIWRKKPSAGPGKEYMEPGQWVLVSILVLFLVVTLARTLSPPQQWDDQVYHLLLPKLYLAAHGFRDVTIIYAAFPLGQEMIYTLAMGVSDAIAAQLFNFSCGILILLCLWALTSGIFHSSRAGLWAAAVFGVSPTFHFEATSAYIELGLCFFTLLSIYSALRVRESRDLRWVIMAGVFSGAILTIKYTSASAVAATGLFILIFVKNHRIAKASLFLAIASCFLLPWFAKNFALTGNPFFPFLTQALGGVGWNQTLFSQYIYGLMREGMGRKWMDYILLFPRLFLFGQEEGYIFTARYNLMLLFICPLSFALVRRKDTFGLWLWFVIVFAAWACTFQTGRFVMPAIAVLAIICGAAFERLLKILPGWIAALLTIATIIFSIWQLPHRFWQVRSDLAFITGRIDAAQYLGENRLQPWLTRIDELQLINELTPRNARIFLLWENRRLYIERECQADSGFEASYNIQVIYDTGNEDRFHAWLLQNHYDYIYNAGMRPWSSEQYLDPRWREEYQSAYDIYRRFVEKYGETVFRKQGELIWIKP